MNFTGRTVLVYLEEDNIQRAYFRVRPLLTDQGPVDRDLNTQYPDEGCLRIVPDKNEQHTFKERMRTLGSVCLLDLSALQNDNQKIRTNKNYSPAKGEKNQFIVYSDAVRPLDGRLFFHVVNEDRKDSALTPAYYTRSGANIQGPYLKDSDTPPAELKKILPDDPHLYTATLPDGTALLIYVDAPEAVQPEDEKADSPAAEAPEAAAPEAGVSTAPVNAAPVNAAPVNAAPVNAAPVSTEEAKETESAPAPAATVWQKQLNAILSGKESPAAPAKGASQHAERPPRGEKAPAAPQRPEKAAAAARSEKGAADPQRSAGRAREDDHTAYDRIQALNGSLNVTSQRLREDRRPYPLQPSETPAPGGGTKLYRPGMDRRVNMRARNSLAEAVEQQRSLSRYETRSEAPGAQIRDPGSLGDVPNPVEQFKYALRRTWMLPDTHRQVADCILSTSGMRQVLTSALTDGKISLTIRAMQAQLQDLEAERLMTLMQLDDAKKNLQAAREAALNSNERRSREEIAALDKMLGEKKALVEDMTARQEALVAECAKAAEVLSSLPRQSAVTAPAARETPDREALTARTLSALKTAGFDCDEDSALALMILFAQSLSTGHMGIASESTADALTAAECAAAALGAAHLRTRNDSGKPRPVRVIPGGDGAVIISDTCPDPVPVSGAVHMTCFSSDDVYLSRFTDRMIDQYRADPFPVWWTRQDPGMIPEKAALCPAVSAGAMADALLVAGGELDEHSAQLIQSIRLILCNAGIPLPGKTAAAVRTFILSAAPYMKGGIAAAMDWAALAYIVPHIRFCGADGNILAEAAAALPRTLTELCK